MFVTRSLDRLVEAGFIRFSDDKPLLLSTTAVHARARENGKPPRSDFDRALAWMRNAGAIVPPERLPGVLAEDFRITDQDELERLLAEVER
jgi:hypothetical protein